MASTQVRTIGVSVPEARHLPRLPSKKELGFAAIFLIVAGVLALGATVAYSALTSRETPAPADSQLVAPPVQQVPAVVIPAIPRVVHAGPWVEIATVRYTEEVPAIPWDRLVTWGRGIPPSPLMIELEKLDMPLANVAYGNPVSGWEGYYILSENRVMMVGISDYRQTEKDPWATTYWEREVTIEGLNP